MSSRRGTGNDFRIPLLDGRTVLVTGGGRGIGAAICHELAVHGADIALVEADRAAAEATSRRIRAIGGEALPLVGDVTVEDDARRAVEGCVRRYGRLDAVVACCAAPRAAALESTDGAMWEAGLEGSLRGVVLVTRFALRHLKQRGFGNIVCVCETATEPGDQSASRAYQWALLGFCDALRAAQEQHRIRVSAVLTPESARGRGVPPELEVTCVPDPLEAAACVRDELAGSRAPLLMPRELLAAPARRGS